MQVGLLGFDTKARQISQKLMDGGHQVVIWSPSLEPVEAFRTENPTYVVQQKCVITHSLEEVRHTLSHPRIFWSMLPVAEQTETALQTLVPLCEQGDVIIDGENARFTDTQRRYETLKTKHIRFLGIGIVGGIQGLVNGFPLMIGGDKQGYEYILPLLEILSKPNASYTYFGEGGAGHFVRMIHDGIEYGMMQAIAEGFGVLEKSPYALNLLDVAKSYQQGSIIASLLVQVAIHAFTKDSTLAQIGGNIGASGEAQWTVEQAREEKVPVPIIEQSLAFRSRSQYDELIQKTFVARMVEALREEIGGHEVKSSEEEKSN